MNQANDNQELQLSPIKRALLEISDLRAQVEHSERMKNEPIAVIGMGLRFPGGAKDPASFWRLLADGVDAIGEVPSDRWDVDAYYDPDPDAPGKTSSRWGGFLEAVDKFDPEFFGISPREAVSMDPQQRLLLEVAWEGLENAGQAPHKLFGSLTGVFVGIAGFDYFQHQIQQVDQSSIDAYFATGSTHSVASGRLSYVLGLRGPSVSLDTACSSSLVAMHQACQSLRNRDCHLALAGGVNVILRPELYINFSKAHVLAADGRCKAFDARADGFVRSEGCGIVVLKRLADALQDGDNIIAVIRGTAVNQDGRSSGLTAPNGPSQQDVIRKALANAGVAPNQVQYVESHGTGTALGDPIEVQALAAVISEGRAKSEPLVIGSVKTNLGHLETAAGVAGLIKVLLSLQHRQIPPHLHLRELNPHIPWDDLPVTVATAGMAWPSGSPRRIAGVSSFGLSGTNAHIIVEEAPAQERVRKNEKRPQHLLTLSAQVGTALEDHVVRWAERLGSQENLAIEDVVYSANAGRSHFGHRLALIADTVQQAQEKLAALGRGVQSAGVYRGDCSGGLRPEVVFMFTGQGAQYAGMGRQLYDSQPIFRATLDQCAAYLRPYLDRPLHDILYPEDSDSSLLHATANTQPALFALEYALAQLWRSWGIEPAAVIGHSVGEYVAACLAGVFDLQDGLRLIAQRGRMMQNLPAKGMMAAVFADKDQVCEAIGEHAGAVAVAAVNTPGNIVISGQDQAVTQVLAQLAQKGIHTQRLNVSHAFHSALMEPMLDAFEACARQVRFRVPEMPLISNLTGSMFNHAQQADAAYWRRHARETVRFADGIGTLYARGYRIFLEIGPHPTLCGLGRQSISDGAVLWLPSMKRGREDWLQIFESLAQLYVGGMEVDWSGVDRDYARSMVLLPTYSFQRERYWIEDRKPERPQPFGQDLDRCWEAAAAAGHRQSLQVPIDLELSAYETKWRSLQSITTAYILRVLRRLGVFIHPGETHSAEELMEQCSILPTYDGLIARWLRRLADEGMLLRRDEQFVSTQALPQPEPGALLRDARQAHHDIDFLLDYIERCGDKLGDILTGREGPLETLFPGGSSQTAESIYQHWALSRYFNGISAAAVGAFARELTPQRKIRILEVGAGTGGTTSSVSQVLPTEHTRYYYTDMSEIFFNKARQKFKAYPFIHYSALDIERQPADQGYAPHSVDVVIAANVLHATRNLSATVQNVLSLLAPGGLLLLYEVTDPHAWFDTTVALIEGWQLFEDHLRTDGPLLTAEQWQNLLRGEGFTEVVALPQTGSAAEVLKAHVMMARAPGSLASDAGEMPVRFADPLGRQADSDSERGPSDAAQEAQDAAVLIRQLEAATANERHDLLVEYVRGHVMQVLNRDPSKSLNRNQRLMDLGVDSLMAVELRTRLGAGLELKRTLPATLIFDYPTIEAVAGYLGKQLSSSAEQPDQSAAAPLPENDIMRDVGLKIEDLSDQEMEQLVLEKLKSMEKGE